MKMLFITFHLNGKLPTMSQKRIFYEKTGQACEHLIKGNGMTN